MLYTVFVSFEWKEKAFMLWCWSSRSNSRVIEEVSRPLLFQVYSYRGSCQGLEQAPRYLSNLGVQSFCKNDMIEVDRWFGESVV